MIPLKELYGQKCNTPVSWDNPIDRAMVGLELLREIEEHMVNVIPLGRTPIVNVHMLYRLVSWDVLGQSAFVYMF
jgi:hypothetical protein